APGTARLARRGTPGERLEPETHAPPDGLLGDVPPVFGVVEYAGREPPAGPDAAVTVGGRGGPRHRAGRERPAEREGRRAERLPAATRGRVPLHAGAARVAGQHRPGPLPPRAVHLLLALGPAPRSGGVRRPRRRQRLHAP